MAENNLITIKFHGNDLETFKEDGIEWVSVRSLCEGMGLHVGSQQDKLSRYKEKFNCTVKRIVAADGKLRESHCIPLKKMPGWLFTIDANRVSKKAKEFVELYQEECFDALYNYWHNKTEKQPTPKQLPAPITEQQTITTITTIEPGKPPQVATYAGKVAIIPFEERDALNDFIKDSFHEQHMSVLRRLNEFMGCTITTGNNGKARVKKPKNTRKHTDPMGAMV